MCVFAVCVFVYAHISVHTHVYIYVCVCEQTFIRRQKAKLKHHSSGAIYLGFLETMNLTGLWLAKWAGWPASSRIPKSLSPQHWNSGMLHRAWSFLCGFWKLNSDNPGARQGFYQLDYLQSTVSLLVNCLHLKWPHILLLIFKAVLLKFFLVDSSRRVFGVCW